MPNDGRQGLTSWFALPAPLKRLFDLFPSRIYAANDFPSSAVRDAEHNLLFVFTTVEDARLDAPSFNPSCLRWQTYLRIAGIEVRTVPSSNHASPSGALPFLLTSSPGTETITTKAIHKWTKSKSKFPIQKPTDMRYESYQALLEGRIRSAWLYQLYLHPANKSVVKRLYLMPASSNVLVQSSIAYQLRQAAEAELRRTSFMRRRQESELWEEAGDAFFALSTLLGERDWFFGQDAGEFDACVFAYTHLILDTQRMAWQENHLMKLLQKHDNLVRHRDRLLDLYY